MKTITLEEIHATLSDPKNGQGQELRKHSAKSHGHQGDIYQHPISAKPDCWDIETTDQSRQVAIGQGEGSHHCAIGPVRVFWPRNADEAAKNCPKIPGGFFDNEPAARRVCIGPILIATGPWRNTHPKHAHHEFPAGTYLITFQLDRRTMRQVKD